MRPSLLWKLLAINLLVVGLALAFTAVSVSRLGDVIFTRLMKEFDLQVDVLHALFMRALTRSLVLSSLVAGGAGLLLSLVLFRRVVHPVAQMRALAAQIAAGNYAARVPAASADELGSLARSLNQMADSLATVERLRKDLVANVAHELRTPLTNLRGYLEAMADGVAPPSAEAIAALHADVMRLVRLVDALHALTLFDAKLPQLQPANVDLSTLLARAVEQRRREVAARGLTVQIEVDSARMVRADADLLTQAIGNLLDNAITYAAEGSAVRVETVPAGGMVRLAVTNTGEGIAAADLPFIFERFYRGEKSRSRARGGAGIGLAIVQEIARAHGGDVGAVSTGGTTTVWLTVPAGPPSWPLVFHRLFTQVR